MPEHRPFSDTELEAGVQALLEAGSALTTWETHVAAVLDAVLHDHDAELERRVRADERAQVAEEIAIYFDRWGAHAQGAIVHAWREAARLARQHATPPATEEDRGA